MNLIVLQSAADFLQLVRGCDDGKVRINRKFFMEENRKVETKKSKVFTRKLISLVLAVVMAVSGFFGVAMSAQAYQKNGYNDTNVKNNLMAWVDATDDQTLEALLDYLDDLLANVDWDGVSETVTAMDIPGKIPSALNSFIQLDLTLNNFPNVKVFAKTKGIASIVNLQITIEGSVNSIDNIIDLMFSVKTALEKVVDKAGTIANIAGYDLSVIGNLNMNIFGNYFHQSVSQGSAGYKASSGSYRDNNSAKYIIKGLLKWLLNDNYENGTSSSIIHNLLAGTFELIPGKRDTIDIYGLLEGTLGLDDWEKDSNDLATYQQNNGIVYNLLKSLIVKNVGLYDDGVNRLKYDTSWVYDAEAYKIANYYLQKLSFNITYPERVDYTGSGLKDAEGNDVEGYANDSSVRRYTVAKAAGKFDASTGKIDSTYATANGWDPNLIYSTEEGYEGNVLVAQYSGMTTFAISANDTLHDAFMRAVPLVWRTALKPTVQLVHVNYNGHDEHGTNFDNAFYYWVSDNIGWNRTDWTQNYTAENMAAFTAAKYQDYGFDSASDFEDYIGYTLTYKETRVAQNKYYNWRDIDASILFNEVRYSPLADQYFHIQTGPLNLYFEEIGCPTVINFFENSFSSSASLISQIDDVLVAAMADLFPNSKNNTVGKTIEADGEYTVTPMTLPALATDSTGTVSGTVSTLINDAAKVLQYAADATDANLLNPFYAFNGANTQVTEANLEEAVIPFAISALKHWSITESIHNSDWDKVSDIESGAVVALSEYLGYIYPSRDYSQYYDLEERDAVVNGETVATYKYIVAKSGESLLNDVIVPMAGDALLFVVTAAGVPVYQQTVGSTTAKTEGYNNNSGSATLLDPYSYTFFGKGSGINNVLWQTVNGVACYFAVDKGIAGLVNLEGQITKTNTVWQNLDVILNRFLPALSQLFPQATSAGDGAVTNSVGTISSKKLIWDQLVCGLADVGGVQLFTKVFTYVGDLFSATPLTQTKILNFVIFDVVKPLVNRVLGSRTGTENIITQTTSTTNPVNNFLQSSYLVNTAIDNLISNLYNLLYGTSNVSAASTSTYRALGFGLNALHVLPKLGDNRIGGVSATLTEHALTSTSVNVKLGVRNESWGFASFYKKADGTIAQRGRYDANITGYEILNPDGSRNTTLAVAADTGYSATGSLPAESYKRVKITGTAPSQGLYTIKVNYTMTAKDVIGGGTSASYPSGVAVDFLYVGNVINEKWTDAFSGNNVTSTDTPTLITESTSGNRTFRVANYIGIGSGASGAAYTYYIKNTATSSASISNRYATVAANTPNYFGMSDATGDFEPSSAANNNVAYVAVNKNNEVVFADDSTMPATEYLFDYEDTVAMGYIGKEVDGELVVSAVTVSTDDISEFKVGTPLAGVYLNTESATIPAQTTKTENDETITTPGEVNVRIFSSESENGLKNAYAPMTIVTTGGLTYNLVASTGDIDGAYASYKEHAAGLATHYITADEYDSVSSAIAPALAATIADGINASNIAANVDVAEDDEALIELAFANTTEAVQTVIDDVIEARKGCNNINYNSPALYEKGVDLAKEAEELLIAKAQQEEKTADDGSTYMADKVDEDGYVVYDYFSYAPAIQLQEAVRAYNDIYAPQAQIVAFNASTSGKLITEEVTHATSKCDDFDDVIAASANDYTDFTATVDSSVEPYEFPYSSKTGHEYDLMDTYNVTVAAGTELKFGAIGAGNKLVNEGATVYTAESWKVYVDALGECIAAINSGATISDCYDARCHLVMAENNLEEGQAEGITISGTIYMAQDANGTTGTFGARGINFKVDGDYVLDAEGQPAETSAEAGHYGEFEIVVPERTTEIVITSDTTVDRTVTLSGTADIEGANIKVVTLDNNKDGKVNNVDFGVFKKKLNGTDIKYDLNNDDKVNNVDFGSFKKVVNKNISYSAQALD